MNTGDLILGLVQNAVSEVLEKGEPEFKNTGEFELEAPDGRSIIIEIDIKVALAPKIKSK